MAKSRPAVQVGSRTSAASKEVDRERIIQHSAHPGRCHGPAICTTVLVDPGGHSGMPLAEPAGRNTDSDADREAPFGRDDHVAQVTWHLEFLVCSDQNATRGFAVSRRSLPPM